MTREDLKLLLTAIVDGGYSMRGDIFDLEYGSIHIFSGESQHEPGPFIMISWLRSDTTIVLREDGKVTEIPVPISILVDWLSHYL